MAMSYGDELWRWAMAMSFGDELLQSGRAALAMSYGSRSHPQRPHRDHCTLVVYFRLPCCLWLLHYLRIIYLSMYVCVFVFIFFVCCVVVLVISLYLFSLAWKRLFREPENHYHKWATAFCSCCSRKRVGITHFVKVTCSPQLGSECKLTLRWSFSDTSQRMLTFEWHVPTACHLSGGLSLELAILYYTILYYTIQHYTILYNTILCLPMDLRFCELWCAIIVSPWSAEAWTSDLIRRLVYLLIRAVICLLVFFFLCYLIWSEVK